MKLGSLNTGAGILDHVAAEFFGATPLWGVDEDHAACAVATAQLDCQFISDPPWTVDWQTVHPIDVFVTGWKQRWGGRNEHSTYWPEIRRALRALRPRYFLMETVPGVFGSGEFHRIIDCLADLGYEFRWATVHAQEAGAPHRRARVFILASHAGFPEPEDFTAPLIPPVKPLGHLLPSAWVSMISDDQIAECEAALRRWSTLLGRPRPSTHEPVAFGEWLMGWPQGWVSEYDEKGFWVPGMLTPHPLPTEYALSMIGSGVVPQQVQMALGRIFNYREGPRIYGVE